MILYQVELAEPLAHRLRIRCTVTTPKQSGEQFRLPTWIPGSYLIREFARHVVDVRAEQNGLPIAVHKIDKQTWQTAALQSTEPLTLTMLVHAWDLSVRGAHVDQFHAFFNGSSVFPEVLEQGDEPCKVEIALPLDANHQPWSLFTTLPLNRETTYRELLDHPVEIGITSQYQVLAFDVLGTPHRMVLRGAGSFNQLRLQQDLAKICTAIITLFGGEAPFDHYDFLVTLTGDGYGGLEHKNSTALLASRDDLPLCSLADNVSPGEGYARFLELCSHEYFHAWVVKRICDQSFVSSILQAEAYSSLLWFFEGFTSYYDALMLVRAGVISTECYLRLIEKTVQQVNGIPGQYRQSVAESSFDAWIKYYRPDDNTPNSVVSYYTKGSLIALSLDIILRRDGLSADRWLQSLWARFGLTETPLTEALLFEHIKQFAGSAVSKWLGDTVSAREPLPLTVLLADVGVVVGESQPSTLQAFGLRVSQEQGNVRISHVIDDSRAQKSGLAAGDLLVAIDGLRVTYANLDTRLQRIPEGKPVTVLAFREDVLISLTLNEPVTSLQPSLSLYTLSFDPVTTPEQLSRRTEWLAAN